MALDLTTVVTIGGIVLANIGTTIGMFIFATSQSLEARKHSDDVRRELDQKFEAGRRDSIALVEAIRKDVQDFHQKLLEIQYSKRGIDS